ncbi:MAG TPA: response regulator [Candidatus Obscuribacterales bacterium]
MAETREIQRVLFVDTDQNSRALAKMGLEGIKEWKLELAGTAAEALVKAAYLQPDLIVMDLTVPGMDVASTMEQLRKNSHLSNVPVIFTGKNASAGEIQKFKKLGAAGYIAKPFDTMTLSDDIEAIVLQFRERRR